MNEALDELEKDGLENGKKTYISGIASPNMADIVIFGILRSIEHLPSFREVMDQRSSDVTKKWYDQMLHEVDME